VNTRMLSSWLGRWRILGCPILASGRRGRILSPCASVKLSYCKHRCWSGVKTLLMWTQFLIRTEMDCSIFFS